MTAVDELRAAAAKIRARAEEATTGPWKADHREYPEMIYGGVRGDLGVVAGSRWGGEASVFDNNDDAYHISLWHPGIALIVAELIDDAADAWNESSSTAYEATARAHALLLARAINGTEVA